MEGKETNCEAYPRSVDNILMSLVRRLLRWSFGTPSRASDTSGVLNLRSGVGLPGGAP
jgi:hypothetical protein